MDLERAPRRAPLEWNLSAPAFALGPLALELAGAADGGGTLAGALLRRLLVVTAQLHLAVDALALQLLLQRAQRLVDIIVANDDLHKSRPTPFPASCRANAPLCRARSRPKSRKKHYSPRSPSSRRWRAPLPAGPRISRAPENQRLNRQLFPNYDESSLWRDGLRKLGDLGYRRLTFGLIQRLLRFRRGGCP